MAVSDQIFFSGGNFLVGLSVARGGTASDLGTYGLLMLWLYASQDLHKAMIWLPMTQLSESGQYRTARRASLMVSSVVALGAALVALAYQLAGRGESAMMVGMLALLIPVLWFHEIQRRINLAAFKPAKAVGCDLVYFLVILGLLLVPTPDVLAAHPVVKALLVLLLGATGATSTGIFVLRRLPRSQASAKGLLKDYWSLSRAYVANALLVAGTHRLSVLVIGLVLGVEALGNVEAARLLVAPLSVAAIGLAAILVPDISRIIKHHDKESVTLNSLLVKWSAVAVALPLMYAILVLGNLNSLSVLVLRHQFEHAGALVALWIGVILTSLVVTVLMAPLGLERRASSLPKARLPGVVLLTVLAVPVAFASDERGVLALLLAEGILTVSLLFFQRQLYAQRNRR